jgi:hypothetical protein
MFLIPPRVSVPQDNDVDSMDDIPNPTAGISAPVFNLNIGTDTGERWSSWSEPIVQRQRRRERSVGLYEVVCGRLLEDNILDRKESE